MRGRLLCWLFGHPQRWRYDREAGARICRRCGFVNSLGRWERMLYELPTTFTKSVHTDSEKKAD